jgi:Uma2 family endonuclease
MSTVQLKLGSADHGRPVGSDDFDAAEFEPGFRYEVIDGRLAVSLEPDPAENELELWLFAALWDYSRTVDSALNHVTNKARVHVPDRPELTIPEPDIAAYGDYPRHRRFGGTKWSEVSPVLVCEVLTGDPAKDLERNVELYFEVPSIREYWVLDGRDDPAKPSLVQHRRYGGRWVVRTHPAGATFTTKLLPGFALVLDPRA